MGPGLLEDLGARAASRRPSARASRPVDSEERRRLRSPAAPYNQSGGGGRDGVAGLTAGGRVGAGAGDGEGDGRPPSIHATDRLRLHAQPGLPAPPCHRPPRPTAGRGEKSTIHFLSNSIPWACHSIWEKSN